MRLSFAATISVITQLSALSVVTAQGTFPGTIQRSDLKVRIVDVATVPDSATGNSAPARMSVMTNDPLGRRFVNDQRGLLYTLDATPGTTAATEYLDLRDFDSQLLSTSEAGFQSFTFHPDFADNTSAGFGKFYTSHSSNNNSPMPDFDPGGSNIFHSVLLEWSVNDINAATYTAAGGTAPREVMRLQQPAGNHNTGLISFNTSIDDADLDYGNLYYAVGDGGGSNDPQNNGQDTGNPYGAILRINPLDPDGTGPEKYTPTSDNQFASDGLTGTLAEIYAYGLRNPQRFGWDEATGALFAADIGQNAIEEINLIANGGNFGWDVREGGAFGSNGPTPNGFSDPIAEYDHTNFVSDSPTSGGVAVTLGEVARNTGIAGLDGKLLTGDFPSGLIFLLDVDAAGGLAENGGQDPFSELVPLDVDGNSVRLLDLINDVRGLRGLSNATRADLRFSWGIGGEVYILNKQDGVIRQLVAVPEPGGAVLLIGLTLLVRRHRRVL